MEGFKQEKPKTLESVSNWRENKKLAPERAGVHLKEHDLPRDIESASLVDLEKLVAELPELIEELSYDASKEIKNENRYVVRELSTHLNAAKVYLNYLNAPDSRIRA